MKYAHMDPSHVIPINVPSLNENDIIILSIKFKDWYQNCLNHSYNIGPINETVLRLWCELKTMDLSDEIISNILRYCKPNFKNST
jgi:hypothetical protein